MVIEVPPKLCRPRVVNKYIPPDYANDINEGIFDFAQYGKAVYRPRKIGKKEIETSFSLLMTLNTYRSYTRISGSVQTSPSKCENVLFQ